MMSDMMIGTVGSRSGCCVVSRILTHGNKFTGRNKGLLPRLIYAHGEIDKGISSS